MQIVTPKDPKLCPTCYYYLPGQGCGRVPPNYNGKCHYIDHRRVRNA